MSPPPAPRKADAGGRVEVRVFAGPAEAAAAAAVEARRVLARAVAEHGAARWALVGGSTPDRLYDLLAADPGGVDWRSVHLFWGDERAVPPQDRHSNFGRARRRLLRRLPIPSGQVHRIRGELPPEEAAREYEERLRELAGEAAAPPRLDLVLLGLGADGHTASLFPGVPPPPGRWVVAARAPAPPRDRVTLTPAVLDRAERICFLALGAVKAEAVARALGHGEGPPPPAATIRPDRGSVLWILDRDAARGLPPPVAGALDVAPTRPGGATRRSGRLT